MIIRKPQKSDWLSFGEMQKELDSETKFMMYEPGERPTGEDVFCGMLDWFERSGSYMLIAMDGGKMVGVIAAERGGFKRTHHVASVSTGVLMSYRRRGIGSRFFAEIEKWARENGVTRLELNVMCHNENAIALYKKSGFEIEGKRTHAMKVDGNYVDEYYMAKILD